MKPHVRLVEIYVRPDLHQKIIKLKGTQTSDQFLRELLINGNASGRKDPKVGLETYRPTKEGTNL